MKNTKRLLFLTGLFSAFLIGSNFMAVKLIDVFGLTLPAAIILYPMCFAVSDVINEFWGFKTTRFVILITFVFNAIITGFLALAVVLPASSQYTDNEAFKTIFLSTPRILAASFIAFVVSGILDSYIFDKIKSGKYNKHLAFRSAVSTLLGLVCDSIMFILLAFWGLPAQIVITMILGQVAAKILLGIGLGTPLTLLTAHLFNKYDTTHPE